MMTAQEARSIYNSEMKAKALRFVDEIIEKLPDYVNSAIARGVPEFIIETDNLLVESYLNIKLVELGYKIKRTVTHGQHKTFYVRF